MIALWLRKWEKKTRATFQGEPESGRRPPPDMSVRGLGREPELDKRRKSALSLCSSGLYTLPFYWPPAVLFACAAECIQFSPPLPFYCPSSGVRCNCGAVHLSRRQLPTAIVGIFSAPSTAVVLHLPFCSCPLRSILFNPLPNCLLVYSAWHWSSKLLLHSTVIVSAGQKCFPAREVKNCAEPIHLL